MLTSRLQGIPRVVKTYSAEIACPDNTVDASVSAFNEAIAAIIAEFLVDIRQSGAPA